MRCIRTVVLCLIASCLTTATLGGHRAAAFGTSDLIGPLGSGRFGEEVIVLPNGNIVVTDFMYSIPTANEVGAVHLYDGVTHQLISTLRGSHTDDHIGNITIVGGSNFVVGSPRWDNGTVVDAGAVTFVNGVTGLSGEITAATSLVGSHAADEVGFNVEVLTNGNYVVFAPAWDNGAVANAGAATWGSGSSGISGLISAANSLVGTHDSDFVGHDVLTLANSNYVVQSLDWTNGAALEAGAVTWGSGVTGVKGPVSALNSLVGTQANDFVGTTVQPLTNGNYVVGSFYWNSGGIAEAGAATWRSGSAASPGTIDATNSIVGSFAGDHVGEVVTALSNGNYAVGSPGADTGALGNTGAATWGNGATGSVGALGSLSSLRGSGPNNEVGASITALANGGYVVGSPNWDAGLVANVGAATRLDGDAPSAATVSAANSLIGNTVTDRVGTNITALANGNYVVASPNWDNGGVANAGATTWGSGTCCTTGLVSSGNSLVGSTLDDRVGFVWPLPNGNYVVTTESWDLPTQPSVGAATWRPGTEAAPTAVSAANSLVGSQNNDGNSATVYALPAGDYLVANTLWSRGTTPEVGAVTWGSASGGVSGPISSANSLVGSTATDWLGDITVFADGTSAVVVPRWDNGPIFDAGAVVFAPPTGLTGPVTATNGFLGQVVSGGDFWNVAKRRTVTGAYVVGRPSENRVTFVTPSDFAPLSPARLADTRPGFTTVDGVNAGSGQLAGGSTFELTVAGRGGVSADAVAVALNVTSVGAVGAGFVTIYPCGATRPTASNLNFITGSIVPNAVIAKVGAGGKVCLFVSQQTDLVVDVTGFFPLASQYRSVNPGRVLETRPGLPTVDGLQQGAGLVPAGAVVEVQVTGRASVVADASAVALNVTATESSAPGFVTVFPCGSPRPTASSLNVSPGGTVANLVVSKIGVGGKVCIFTQSSSHLVADVNGFFPVTTTYKPLDPARLLETRAGLTTKDGQFNGAGLRPAGTITTLKVAGRGGVPATVAAAVLNVTVDAPVGAGFITVYPCGIDPPLASNLNFTAGQTIPNAVIVKVGPSGDICLLNSQATHLVADVVGYFPD